MNVNGIITLVPSVICHKVIVQSGWAVCFVAFTSHHAGSLMHWEDSFDDCIAAALLSIAEQISQQESIAIGSKEKKRTIRNKKTKK